MNSFCCYCWSVIPCPSSHLIYTPFWTLALRMGEVTQEKTFLQASVIAVLNLNDIVWLVEEFRVWNYYENIITLAHPSLLSFLLFLIPCNSWRMTLRVNLPNRAYQHQHYRGKRVSLFLWPRHSLFRSHRLRHFCECQLGSWYSFSGMGWFVLEIRSWESDYGVEANHLQGWRDYLFPWDYCHLPILCLPLSSGIQLIFPFL